MERLLPFHVVGQAGSTAGEILVATVVAVMNAAALFMFSAAVTLGVKVVL